MYIQSDIIIHTDIKNAINMWVTDIYNGDYSIINCTEKEYNKIYFDYDSEDIYDSSDCVSNSQLMNFYNYYFERYYDSLKCYEEMAYEYYLENAAENYLLGEYNNYDEEYINGSFISIDDSDFSDSD